jgi:SAM-dependent methyltransferase
MKERINCWDYMHKEDNHGALSGCGYQETIDFLKLGNILNKGDRVLEVGVGLGYVTKGLYENDYNVMAFDISPVALERVRRYCDMVFSLNKLDAMPSNYFDVIFCHNVVQHIPTPYLYYELFHLIRSLKPSGVLAVKSVSTDLMEDTGDDPDLIIGEMKCSNSIGCFCRSISYFSKIVDRCGGVAKIVYEEPIKALIITNQHVFHITKKVLI